MQQRLGAQKDSMDGWMDVPDCIFIGKKGKKAKRYIPLWLNLEEKKGIT